MIDARGFNDSTSAIGFILAWENEGLHISNARNDQLFWKDVFLVLTVWSKPNIQQKNLMIITLIWDNKVKFLSFCNYLSLVASAKKGGKVHFL